MSPDAERVMHLIPLPGLWSVCGPWSIGTSIPKNVTCQDCREWIRNRDDMTLESVEKVMITRIDNPLGRLEAA